LSRHRDHNDAVGNLAEGETPFPAEPVVQTIEGVSYDRGELLQIRADRSAAERFGQSARAVAPSPIFAGLKPISSPKPGRFHPRQSLRRG
jgi:hypothetical protein